MCGVGGVFNSINWSNIQVSEDDELEQELFAEIKAQTTKTKALTTWNSSYISNIKRFIKWCKERNPPREFMPASASTVALYLQFVAREAKSYSRVKSASGAIYTLHESALYPKEEIPTQAPPAHLVREAAKRKIGLRLSNQKEPLSASLLNKAILLFISGKKVPLWKVMVAGMIKVMWMGFLRYKDAKFVWVELIHFYPTHMEFLLSERKNDVYREGDVVYIAREKNSPTCAVAFCERIIKEGKLKGAVNLFQGFCGHTARWTPEKVKLNGKHMKYDQLLSQLHQVIGKATSWPREKVREVFGTQSMRSGGATVAAKKVPYETWKRHGAWHSDTVPLRYVGQSTTDRLETTIALANSHKD